MKVIDLLNEIANGENISNNYMEYFNRQDQKYDICLICLANLIYKLDNDIIELNDTVEIIEEKEMCHKCHKYPAEYNQTYCEFCLGISKLEEKKIPQKLDKNNFLDNETLEQVDADLDFLIDKINEIIDTLEMLNAKIK